MNQKTEPKPVVEKPFQNSVLVICGFCRGRKLIPTNNGVKECPYCLGEGVLHRVTEGTMKLFPTK
jgi:DnaJ-class molecular chaperone